MLTKKRTLAGLFFLALIVCLAVIRTQAQGGDIHYGETMNGSLSAGVTDTWHFSGTEGDVIALTVERSSGDLQPMLVLQDTDGVSIAGNQAPSGQGMASLVKVRLPQTASYLVQISGNEKTTGAYSLKLELTTKAAATVTAQPTVAAFTLAGTLVPGVISRGKLDNVLYRQFWKFRGTSGDVIDLRMVSVSGDLDAALSLIGPQGDVVAVNESGNGKRDAGILAFELPFSGDYTVIARRAGSNAAQGSTTSGGYELSVTLRGPGTASKNTTLNLNVPVRGRLNVSTPQAIYRLEIGGAIALQLDLGSLHRLANVRFLTTNGNILANFQGLSPLLVSTQLPEKGPFLVEVSSSSYEDTSFTDFGLTVFHLSKTASSPQPLAYGHSRRAIVTADDNWYFLGNQDDLITLNVLPDTAGVPVTVKVTGPQDVLLYQGDLGAGLQQNLSLPATGIYQINIHPAAVGASVAYETRVDQIGANGITFHRFDVATDQGALVPDSRVTGTLAAGAATAYWIDVAAGQTINLALSPESSTASFGLALKRPDGSLQDVQTTRRVQGAVISQAILDQTGRYRVVVFDSQGSTGGKYTLNYEDVGGGALIAGKTVKGIASPANGFATWTIHVDAGAMINSRLVNITPQAWTPSLSVTDPNGAVIATTNTAQGAELDLLGIDAPVTGVYQIVVGGQVTGTFASYNLLGTVQLPFAENNGTTIQVSTTRPPTTRYAALPPSGPTQVHITELLNPALNTSKLNGTGTAIVPGSTVRGEIANGALVQPWVISAAKDTTLSFTATSISGINGPDLTLLDKNGKIVHEQLHSSSATTVLTYAVPESENYTLIVQLGLQGGRYILASNVLNYVNSTLRVADGLPITYGQTIPGEILTASQPDAYYFLGLANDVVTIQLARATHDLVPALELVGPNGTGVSNDANAANGPTATISQFRLPSSGLYTILAERARGNSTTGRYSLYLGIDSGVRLRNRGGGLITPGDSVTGSVSSAENEDTWLFHGHSGERVTFVASGIGPSRPSPLGLRLQDSAGQTFAAQDILLAQGAVQLTDMMLPSDGVYRIQVTGGTQTPGTYLLTWQPEQERLSAGSVRYNQTVGGVFDAQHNADSWVFSGTAGDVVSISLYHQSGALFKGGFQVLAENGLRLTTVADLGDGSGARTDNLLLPFSGSYTVVVGNPDPAFTGAGVYSLSVNLQDSKARSMGSILHYGEQSVGDLYVDDPVDTWIFSARAGDVVGVAVQARDQFLKPAVELHTPAGTLLASAAADTSSDKAQVAIVDFSIPANGVYVINISGGAGKTTGSYLLALDSKPPAITGFETIAYGDTKEGLIASDRTTQKHRFTGKLEDTITATVTRETGSNLSAVLELRTADGQLLARADSNDQDSATIANFQLPYTGDYVLIVSRYLDEQGKTSGRYKIVLNGTAANVTIHGTVSYGKTAIGRLDDQSPSDRITFTGKAGDVVSVVSKATSGDLDTYLTLESAAGDILAANDDADGSDAVISGALLPADGTYTVVISRVGTKTGGSSGNYDLHVNLLYQVNATAIAKTLISYGQRLIGSVDPQNAEVRYTFSGNQGDEISVQLVHQTDDAPPLLSIQDPANTLLASGTLGVGQTTIDHYRLPVSGLYNIVIKRTIDTRFNYSPFALTLDLQNSAAGLAADGGVINPNTAVTGAFTSGQTAQYWLLQGKTGQVISINLLQLSGDLQPSLILISPGGHGLTSASVVEHSLSASIDQFVLPSDGVYSLLVVPGAPGRTGQYRLTIQPNVMSPSDTSPLAAGQVVSGTLDSVQPEQRWSFDGQTGQTITARMLVTSGDLAPQLQLIGINGNVIAESRVERTADNQVSAVLNATLESTGTYALVAGQQLTLAPTSGDYRLSLETGALSPQVEAALPIAYEQSVQKVIQQGTTDLWVFSGTVGDTVAITVQATATITNSNKVPVIDLQDASGRSLSQGQSSQKSESIIQGFTLPTTGRYVVTLPATNTVGYTLVIQRRQSLLVQDAANTRPLVPDQPLDGAITTDTDVNYWTFNAKAGNITLITGVRLSGDLRLDLALYGPSGYLGSVTEPADGTPVNLGPVRLPGDGNYILVATRQMGTVGKTNGHYSLKMSFPTGPVTSSGGFIPVYGQAVVGGISPSDDNDVWTFDGQAGDVVDIRATRLDGDLIPTLNLASASGDITSAKADQDTASLSHVILPTTGKYSVTVSRTGQTTGNYRLEVDRTETSVQASISRAAGIAYGEQQSGELTDKIPAQAWVFVGKAGERVAIQIAVADSSTLDPYLVVLAPDGVVLATDDNSGGGSSARLSSVLLPTDGFYGVVVTASPASGDNRRTGKFLVSVQQTQPGATNQGQITIGADTAGMLSGDQPIQEWNFEGGQSVAATVSSTSELFDAVLSIVDSNGHVLAVSAPTKNGTASVETTLPAPGHYAVLVRANTRGAQGSYRLNMSNALAPTGGGKLLGGDASSGAISSTDFTDTWRLDTKPGTTVDLSVARTSGDLDLAITLYAPDGSVILEQAAKGADGIRINGTLLDTGGTYLLVISRTGGAAGPSTGTYQVTVTAQL